MIPLRIAPSMIAADASRLKDVVLALDHAGADLFHWDIMDGHFVPNITFGPDVVAACRPHSRKEFDVHLMVANPEQWIVPFAKAGADTINVHIESATPVEKLIPLIKELNKKAGIAINPMTPLTNIPDMIWPHVHRLTIMTVVPGFSGQAFIDLSDKIAAFAEIKKQYPALDIMIDGGINSDTAKIVARAGANSVVTGSALFKDNPIYADRLSTLRGVA